jgi:hypothetical protein
MSDFGLFENDEATQAQPRLAAKTAARQMEAAIDVVRSKFGRFLMGATGIDEFGDRWHLSKHDIRATVEPYVFPNTGTMRRIQNAMKADWKLAHPYKVAGPHDSPEANAYWDQRSQDKARQSQDEWDRRDQSGPLQMEKPDGFSLAPDPTAPIPSSGNPIKDIADRHGLTSLGYHRYAEDRDAPLQDLDETYHPSGGNLIPEGDFHGYQDSVDQGGPEKVQRDFTPGGDSGRSARRRQAGEGNMFSPGPGQSDALGLGMSMSGQESTPAFNPGPMAPGLASGPQPVGGGGWDGPGTGGVVDMNSEPAAGSISPEPGLPTYQTRSARVDVEAAKLVADIYTDFARSNGLRVASLETLDHYAATGIHDDDYRLLQSMIVRTAEAEDDCECDDENEESGPPESESEDGGDNEDSGDDAESAPPSDSDSDDDDSGEDDTDGGEDEFAGGGDGPVDDGGDDGFPGGDQGGQSFTVPDQAPELDPRLQQEIPQDDQGGSAPVPPEVIDSILGLPEGTIEQLLLEEVEQGAQGGAPGQGGFGGPPPASPEQSGPPQGGGGNPFGDEEEQPRTARRRQSARSFWAAEGDEQQQSAPPQQGAPAPQDPSAGMDPSAMGGGDPNAGMAPPQDGGDPAAMGGGQPPAPQGAPQGAPAEDQPAEDQLLDMASNAVQQMIQRETQEYQQIVDPLTQALQAIQFAQQIEQAEHPLDVTPPEGSVDVSPAAAPGGAQSLQQQASRRQAKVDTTLRDAAAVIANRYRLSRDGYRMLVSAALSGRGYSDVAEALKVAPPRVRTAAARHVSHLLAAGNPQFRREAFLKTVLAGDLVQGPLDRGWENMDQRPGSEEMYRLKYMNDPRQHGGPGGAEWSQDYRDAEQKWLDSYRAEYPAPPEDDFADGHDNEDGYRTGSRQASRRPFDRPRLAGETWINTPVQDTFEFENDRPRVSDNIAVSNLPNMPGGHIGRRRLESKGGVMERFQRWQQQQQEKGLNFGDGDIAAEGFVSQRSVGPGGAAKLHKELGISHPPGDNAVKSNPKPSVTKAKNPVTKRGSWGEWEPTKEASFFTRRVPDWKWDDHLAGYISKEGKAFTCSCGQKIAAPSYKTCSCGKVWNITALGSTQHLASDTADFYVAREIPVRPGVILAGKNMESGIPSADGEMDSDSGVGRLRGIQPRTSAQSGSNRSASTFWEANSERPGTQGEYCGQPSRVSHRAPGAGQYSDGALVDGSGVFRATGGPSGATPQRRSTRQPSGESGLRDAVRQHGGHGSPRNAVAAAETGLPQRSPAGGTQPGAQSTSARVAAMSGVPAGAQLDQDAPRGGSSRRGGSPLSQAKPTQRELVAMIDKLADWTKYDDEDPARQGGPKKPPSTSIPKQPKDWAKRDSNGTWQGPAIPRKKK